MPEMYCQVIGERVQNCGHTECLSQAQHPIRHTIRDIFDSIQRKEDDYWSKEAKKAWNDPAERRHYFNADDRSNTLRKMMQALTLNEIL